MSKSSLDPPLFHGEYLHVFFSGQLPVGPLCLLFDLNGCLFLGFRSFFGGWTLFFPLLGLRLLRSRAYFLPPGCPPSRLDFSLFRLFPFCRRSGGPLPFLAVTLSSVLGVLCVGSKFFFICRLGHFAPLDAWCMFSLKSPALPFYMLRGSSFPRGSFPYFFLGGDSPLPLSSPER